MADRQLAERQASGIGLTPNSGSGTQTLGAATFGVRVIDPSDIKLSTSTGSVAGNVTFSAGNISNSTISFSSSPGLTTGQAVIYESSGSAIGNLTNGTTYYAIVGSNLSQVQLALSPTLAGEVSEFSV